MLLVTAETIRAPATYCDLEMDRSGLQGSYNGHNPRLNWKTQIIVAFYRL